MALVAYDDSDSSDYEDEENNTVGSLQEHLEKPGLTEQTQKDSVASIAEEGPTLFKLLPQPSNKKPAVIEEDDEFLHKKEKVDVVKPKAKISVPSLRDFKDVESPSPAKPKAANVKKSGLLSILPQPKNGFTITTSKSFVPHVVTQRNNAKNANENAMKKASIAAQKSKKSNDNSDESDIDDDVQNDFFSIHKSVEVPVAEIPQDSEQNMDDEVPVKRSKLESYFKQDPIDNHTDLEPPMEVYEDYASSEASSSYVNSNAEGEIASNGDIEIDQEAILKLCGARGKRNREEIQMVDVNQRDLLADAREWLLKGLMDDSTKRVSSSKRKGNEPTSQQKRKHQITYLAHQAKANEAELQNQWANSRMSRRQTQNKYGF